MVEKRGALDVEIQGTIIEIRPGSGFIMRCPECNRVLQNDECSIHGKIDGKPDLRIKLIVDDGSGAVNSVLNQKNSENILGKTIDECKKTENEDLIEEIKKQLFAQRVIMKGNALGDNFGTTFIPKEVKILDVKIEEEAEKLSEALEDLE